ncbi:Glycosyltransferase involved in cell wall bisynthesis [Nitrosospira multiformis]|uniref:Glycosyltransferase involved in cell wall bisynthesis n=1 Tax=Nitrosospira multiformis TaxID=1231 RepID=A0A1I0A8Z9_9PROT|nr:glycosyltransferase family 1 protein [Nitrosospira multiformis]SES89719.1 Glycosyltransferase involved in cell wall bisynthesis [Nitrosospira multiformis]
MKDSALRVGIYQGPEIPQSFKVYAENVWRHLPKQDIATIPFKDRKDLPKSADVLWDIRSGGGNPPPDFLLEHPLPPLVVTVHGFAPVSLNGWEYFRTLKGLIMSGQYAKHKRERWREVRTAVGSIIAVSAFVKDEAIRFTGVPADRIHVCHHGVDSNAFTPGSDTESEPYFFHISNDEPRKNVRAIVRAFRQLRRHCRAQLVLKLPEESARNYEKIEGIRVLSGFLTTEELVRLYRHALAFIFPSLYEGFGLPILEAMACGCPVITSNVSACPEIAGEAAITVDPRDEDGLLEAMRIFCQNPRVRAERAAVGLQRSQDFSWSRSAQCHANILRAAASKSTQETFRNV